WNARENRYRQPELTSIEKKPICGHPDIDRASTSYVERLNLGLRMHNRKMTRLTNGHAKSLYMLDCSLALTYTHYNFVKPHSTLGGRTPAMAAGRIDRRMTLAEFVLRADVLAGNRAEAA